MTDYSPQTKQNYEKELARFPEEDWQMVYDVLSKIPYSRLDSAKGALEWHFAGKPSRYNKDTTGESHVRKIRRLTPEEAERMVKWPKGRSGSYTKGIEDSCMMAMIAYAKIHPKAIVNLTWEDRVISDERVGFLFDEWSKKEWGYIPVEINAELENMWVMMHGDKPMEGPIFYTVPAYRGDESRPMGYHTLWRRFKDSMMGARKAGVIDSHFRCVPTELSGTLSGRINANKKDVIMAKE